jgi:hypothetical protein
MMWFVWLSIGLTVGVPMGFFIMRILVGTDADGISGSTMLRR